MASLLDQFADPHVIGGVPACGQQDQARLALRLERRAVTVAGVLAQPGQRWPQDRDQLGVADQQAVPQRYVMEPDVGDLVAEGPLPTPVVITEIREQLVGQHDVVVGRSALRGERVERAVAVTEKHAREPGGRRPAPGPPPESPPRPHGPSAPSSCRATPEGSRPPMPGSR